MNTFLLYAALLVTYFGDYCTLIGLFEYAKTLGSSDSVILLSIVYSIPPVFFFFFADRWSRHQSRPARQLAYLLAAGALVLSTLFLPASLPHLVVVSLVLGGIKQGGQVLLNTFIKRSFNEIDAPRILGNTVSLRFFIMVFGGALGAYLGGKGMFSAVFAIDALSFIIAGAIFFTVKDGPVPLEPETEPAVGFRAGAATFREMASAFGVLPLLWTFVALGHIGLFMALEYPLLTSELLVPTHLIGVVWAGHVIGTLVAQLVTQRLIRTPRLKQSIVAFAVLQVLAFGTIGYSGLNLAVVAVHMAVSVFFMVGSEVLAGVHLMNVSTQENFPRFSLVYRSVDLLIQMVSSLIPLFVFGTLSLQQINLASAMGFLSLPLLAALLARGAKPAMAVVALVLLSSCTRSQSSKDEHLALHSEILSAIGNSLRQTSEQVDRAAKKMIAEFNDKKACAPHKKTQPSDISSSYFPKSTKPGRRLDCMVESSRTINPMWKSFYEGTDFLSWLYLYDAESRYMRIYPATNVHTLFGDDLNFDPFLFYTLAVAKYPQGVWVPIKFDVNGTGRILIYSQAVKLGNTSKLSTISADVRPVQLFKNQQERLSEYAAARKSPHVFMYAYQTSGEARTLAYDFSTDSSKWRVLRSFNGTSLQVSKPELQLLNAFEQKANTKDLVQSQLTIDGTSHLCSAGVLPDVDITVILCEEL